MKSNLLAQIKLPGGDSIDAPDNVPVAAGDGAIASIISWVIIVLVAVGVIASLIFLIIGAIKWITSGGDIEKLSSAKRTVVFSIIGLVVVLLSVVIMQFIAAALGTKIF